MRIDFSGERVLAVVAHPDDADLLCAGTLARARDDGAAIGVCVLCQGDKGQPSQRIEGLAAVRRREMGASARLLGAELFLGDCPDGQLADEPGRRSQLVEFYRRFQPTLVLAHWPDDYHPDHRAAGQLAEAASWFCASAGHAGAAPRLAQPPSLWWMDTVDMAGFRPGFYVDVSRYVELKQQLLACHKSQLERAGEKDFGPLIEQMLHQGRTRGSQAGVEAAEAFRVHLAWKRTRAW
ncbi:MAG TPA: LmbE family protein [Planctomycetaceae bacterium]|nr:LmbE family protein [Planctomycetaceae bacterium]HIQ23243.1 LmbE family protein [Planctomycetota bacterium]